ncbi:MAG: DEAD/DEAH box helicase [Bacillota bacterium]
MNLLQILDTLEHDPAFRERVAHWEKIPARPARLVPFPDWLDPRLVAGLEARGITSLYTHQEQALGAAAGGRHTMVVTPTASGKTLCYNLPVLHSILDDPASRALYIFPTKALAQDQVSELTELIGEMGTDIKAFTYDGDTPASARKAIRSVGHIVVTNPDMLHTAILPHHTRWVKLFGNLKYVVIDETHQYRGVFGSHFANVLRRLCRICRFYGSNPVFICCSATVANPAELAFGLIGEPVVLVDDNGAPSAAKDFIFYNPPVVNAELGIRRSSVLEACSLAERFLRAGVQTIVFARARTTVELLVTYLRRALGKDPDRVRGYRGGYLPRERRAIEKGLRQGDVLAVASTNALELGIDIGALDVSIMAGYPGTIASAWQQAGRAGRRLGRSVAILVGSSSPLDQFLMTQPGYFFGRRPEHGLLNPDNLYILTSHLKCAAFELPFAVDEEFGVPTTRSILDFLAAEGILHQSGDRYYWMTDTFPAEEISLRSAAAENFVIIDREKSARVIGEVDRFSAPLLIHEEAIYIHEGNQYHVDHLDYEAKKAYVRPVEVDYYTDANLAVSVEVLEQFQAEGNRAYGEVTVRALVTMFKKIKLFTHENAGSGPVRLPEEQMHTSAYWLALDAGVTAGMGTEEIQSGLAGLAHLLSVVAPLFAMCDYRDLRVVPQVRAPYTGLPTVFLYDAYPGGVGLSERLYHLHYQLLEAARALLGGCRCADGCPACVGPPGEVGRQARQAATLIIDGCLKGREHERPDPAAARTHEGGRCPGGDPTRASGHHRV